jgi:hydroxymethylglutaryl-CoA lyase
MNISVYEVGPRDGLQALGTVVSTKTKRLLIKELYASGITDIEEVSFAHPKVLPQMADAEAVYNKGAGLVMNKRGFLRAQQSGVDKINIVFSPCETFNIQNMGKTRSEIVLMYKTFMDKVPKEKVRVYLSMAFGSPHSGEVSSSMMRLCLRDAKMFGTTVVFSDTVGCGTRQEVALWAEMAQDEGLTPALHLHHKGDEASALSLVRSGLMSGIKQFDSSIGGLGGCPFAKGSGANLSTEALVRHLNVWGFNCGIKEADLRPALDVVKDILKGQEDNLIRH